MPLAVCEFAGRGLAHAQEWAATQGHNLDHTWLVITESSDGQGLTKFLGPIRSSSSFRATYMPLSPYQPA